MSEWPAIRAPFRLGCHYLRCSTSRMEKVRGRTCECFKSGEMEMVQHMMLHCPAFAKERKGFLERACKVQPVVGATSRLKPAEIMHAGIGLSGVAESSCALLLNVSLLNTNKYISCSAPFLLTTPAPVLNSDCALAGGSGRAAAPWNLRIPIHVRVMITILHVSLG